MKRSLIAVAITLLLATMLRAQTNTPILLELFTSEGCSSCPPADDLLREFNGKRINGSEIVAISEHVTYWNHLGWSDPFSAQIYTTRQSSYSERLHLRDIYTPQMILNGSQEFVGSDRAALLNALKTATGKSPMAIHIDSAAIHGNTLDLRYTVSGAVPEKGIEVAIALTVDVIGSKVTAGENSGHTLTHASVARAIAHVATLRSAAAQLSFRMQLPAAALINGAPHRRLILFAQEFDLGKVLSVDTKLL